LNDPNRPWFFNEVASSHIINKKYWWRINYAGYFFLRSKALFGSYYWRMMWKAWLLLWWVVIRLFITAFNQWASIHKRSCSLLWFALDQSHWPHCSCDAKCQTHGWFSSSMSRVFYVYILPICSMSKMSYPAPLGWKHILRRILSKAGVEYNYGQIKWFCFSSFFFESRLCHVQLRQFFVNDLACRPTKGLRDL
jgi:hypothetical protein